MISLSNWTEITDRDGPLLLYFNRELPEPFSREKIPHASIIVSQTWKLRFTSNSISRSGTGLGFFMQTGNTLIRWTNGWMDKHDVYWTVTFNRSCNVLKVNPSGKKNSIRCQTYAKTEDHIELKLYFNSRHPLHLFSAQWKMQHLRIS